MNTPNPSQLISECIAGDEHAIETLVRRYETGVYRFVLSVTNDPEDATEITQETFIAALKALPRYEEKSSFKAWLYAIALNRSRGHLRRRRVLGQLRETLTAIFRFEAPESVNPEDTLIENEKERVVWDCLKQLDERHRVVTLLRYFHELSVSEIAQVLSIREGTVHSRLHKAREKLRIALASLNTD